MKTTYSVEIKEKFFDTCIEIERYWQLKDRFDHEIVNGLATTKYYSDGKNNVAVLLMVNGEYTSLTII